MPCERPGNDALPNNVRGWTANYSATVVFAFAVRPLSRPLDGGLPHNDSGAFPITAHAIRAVELPALQAENNNTREACRLHWGRMAVDRLGHIVVLYATRADGDGGTEPQGKRHHVAQFVIRKEKPGVAPELQTINRVLAVGEIGAIGAFQAPTVVEALLSCGESICGVPI